MTTARPTADGFLVGEAITDKVGFYGTTPIAQRAGAAQAAIGADIAAIAGGEAPTEAEHNALITRVNALSALVNELRASLVALGAIKGAA